LKESDRPFLVAASSAGLGCLGVLLLSLLGILIPTIHPFIRTVLWPYGLLMSLAGRGPNIGSPEQPLYEGTPVHLLAAVVGLMLSWLFYSVAIGALWWRRRSTSTSPE